MLSKSRRVALALLLAAPLPLSAASPPGVCGSLTTAPQDASARFRAVHVDTLDPKLKHVFEDARRGWLKATEPKRAKGARVYRLTPRGAEVLKRIRRSLGELTGEVARPRRRR